MSPFLFQDYKEFLKAQVKAHQSHRGYRSLLAEAAGCQLSFLSQVLHSHVHLTPDQAAGLAKYWGLDSDERDYFLELVHLGRASSRTLREIQHKRLEELRRKREDLAQRFKKPAALGLEHQAQYYGSWHFSAIHMILTIPEFQAPEAIAKRLSLSREIVQDALEKLAQMDLAVRKGDLWQAVPKDIHLARTSAFTSMNHMNWRSRAVLNSSKADSKSLHYTAVHTLSEDDFEKLREMILKFLDGVRETVRPSKEEELACFTMDWFVV